MIILPPETEAILMERAYHLAGKTLGELAAESFEMLPHSLHQSKGWIGQLIEKRLGAHSGSLAQPDFVDLGIELKTLPVTPNGRPCESTYICTAPIPPVEKTWRDSRVWRKMAKILWVPIESSTTRPLSDCRIGTPILWSASYAIEQQLQKDWEELTEMMQLGLFSELSAQHGQYLQIRPKAANSKTFIHVTNQDGQIIAVVPKGFYLRTSFTQQILNEHYFF